MCRPRAARETSGWLRGLCGLGGHRNRFYRARTRLDVQFGWLQFDGRSMREEGEDRNRSANFHRASSRGAAPRFGPAACGGLLDCAEGLTSRFIALQRDLNALEVEHVAACMASVLKGADGSASLGSHEHPLADDGLAEEILLSALLERATDLGATCRDAIPVPEPVAGIDDFSMHQNASADQACNDQIGDDQRGERGSV